MKRAIIILITLLSLVNPVTINELGANWPQIPFTNYIQPYGNIIVHSDFRLIPQSIIIRWSLSRDIWVQRLNGWTLEQSPMPVHIILISTERRAQIFQGFPAFTASGAHFYDSNNNAFWFDEDISQSATLVLLEDDDSYLDLGGNYYVSLFMLEKLFRWITGPNGAWNTRRLWGHNPFLLNGAEYIAAQVVAKAGPPPPEFNYSRHNISWEETRLAFQQAGWPKKHLARVPPPLPSPIVARPDRYSWYLSLGIIDRETAALLITKILLFFVSGERGSRELPNLVIRENLQILERVCEKRKDC